MKSRSEWTRLEFNFQKSWEIFDQNHAIKKARTMQSLSFSRGKTNQNVISRMQFVFENLTCGKIFNQSLTRCKFPSIENLTCCFF